MAREKKLKEDITYQEIEKKGKSESLDKAISEIKKQFGNGAIMKFNSSNVEKIESISTGSMSLDNALGIGGLPRGRIVEIYGFEGSSKTTLALHVIREAQKLGEICAFIDAEHALDINLAKTYGVNVDELLISQTTTGEEALEIADTLISSGSIGVVVIDSVAALVPKVELEGEMGQSHMGLQARLLSQACLAEDTELLDPLTGRIATIKDIVDNKYEWNTTTYDEQNKTFIYSKVTDWVDQGSKNVYNIKTYNHNIKLTADHKVLTFDGWKQTKDLTTEDYIALPYILPEVKHTNTLTDDAIKIIAYILGDGNSTTENYGLTFTKTDPIVISDLANAVKSFNCELIQLDYKSYRIKKNDNLPLCSYKSPVKTLLKEVGLHGKKSFQKEIPFEIFKLDNDKLALFISRLWSTDGHVTDGNIVYSSTSINLIKQLKHLLLRFRIHSKVLMSERPPYKNLYKLNILGRKNINIFIDKIGLVGRKNDKLNLLLNNKKYKSNQISREEIIPYSVVDLIKKYTYAAGYTGQDISHLLGKERTSFPEFKPDRLKISRDIINKIGNFIDNSELKEMGNSQLCWAKINSINPEGIAKVYDLSIKDDPNFLANGIVVHNCRKLTATISKTNTIAIFINQIRQKLIAYGDPNVTTAGNALKFYSSVRLETKKRETIKDGDRIIGQKVHVKVVKNKVAPPFSECDFDLIYGKGIDKVGEIVDLAEANDIIQKSGAWYKYNGNNIGQGREKTIEYLDSNKNILDEIETKLYV